MTDKKTYSVTEAAEILGFSKSKVRDLCMKGIIGASQYEKRGKWMIPSVSLDAYMKVRR